MDTQAETGPEKHHDPTVTPAEPRGKPEGKRRFPLWDKVVAALGIEVQGSEPVKPELQTDRRYVKLYTLWFSMNFNLIPISTGMAGTLSFDLGLRDCALVIIFFGLLTAVFAPYFSRWGPVLGLRQMIHARYAFGLYAVIVPLILNMATLTGYGIIGSILSGQALSAINPSALSVTAGIVIIALLNLIVQSCGAAWIHHFDLYAWIPTLVALIAALGASGGELGSQVEAPPATAKAVLSFGALVGGFFLPWAAIASDFSTYFDPRVKGAAIFVPCYLGLVLGALPPMVLGAAIGGALPNHPDWQTAYAASSVGGVMGAMLSPLNGFGSFLLVVLALSVLANVIGTVYALSLNLQSLLMVVRIRLPRAACALVLTIVIVVVAIEVAAKFLESLENFLGIICYWPACFIAVIMLEHMVFRKGRPGNYDLESWDRAGRLPSGVAALGASVLSFALVIPGMNQLWFVGPIAEKTGDIGFEMAFAVTALLYVPFRYLEIRLQGRV